MVSFLMHVLAYMIGKGQAPVWLMHWMLTSMSTLNRASFCSPFPLGSSSVAGSVSMHWNVIPSAWNYWRKYIVQLRKEPVEEFCLWQVPGEGCPQHILTD